MANMYEVKARQVPPKIRKIILEEQFIDKARNVQIEDSPMEYLFDVYSEFLDPSREYSDWSCHRCREHVLAAWRKMKPFLDKMSNP